uniref:Uncharacterized protein n=1 Tax=Romanomermis culicivorax TaxID=13658 RepID=A0A915K765_ROMCU
MIVLRTRRRCHVLTIIRRINARDNRRGCRRAASEVVTASVRLGVTMTWACCFAATTMKSGAQRQTATANVATLLRVRTLWQFVVPREANIVVEACFNDYFTDTFEFVAEQIRVTDVEIFRCCEKSRSTEPLLRSKSEQLELLTTKCGSQTKYFFKAISP